ncbi:hypothetical protein Bca4012_058580 [Brassica carinata]|uniref:DUF4283 domain-containing protein n=1 Tax=Brassica carinata TaxID=52824 RepID=A0A8X7W483_BRACI|nr:hypothetical protein Bca52824_016314 [Brassica carinata]
MVGYFMNDAPHIGSILSTVNKIWASQGRTSKIDVQFIGKKTVLFLIEDEGVRNRVMRRKFWDIADVPLVVYEWNPETAQAPPDLSAMPLGVDLKNVPGYLYSKKSLSFLSRTAGKFVKLHLNTERCIRLDVARMLVEVDFQKPLPQKICFVDKDGTDVTVEVRYHWLPPCCGNCLKWGHNENDCQVVKPLTLLQRQEGEGPPAVNIDQQHDSEKPSGDVVSDLIVELEETVGSLVHHSRRGGLKGQVTQPQEDWALAQGRRSVTHSPPKIIHTAPRTISPGRFQVLQDLREEGEITGEGDDEESIRIENAVVEDVAANTTELVKRQGSHQGTRDFNVALSMEEHSNATNTGGDRRSISEFQEVIKAFPIVLSTETEDTTIWKKDVDEFQGQFVAHNTWNMIRIHKIAHQSQDRLTSILLRLVFLVTIYHIWRERNDRRHNNVLRKTVCSRIMSTRYYEKPKLKGLLQRWFATSLSTA